jgi:hypothetical protein
LQASRQVRRLADDAALLRRAGADQVTDHDKSRGDAEPRLQSLGKVEAGDRRYDRKPGPHRPLGVVFMRLGVAEINQDPVAHIFGDKTFEAGDGIGDGAMIRPDDLAQIFRIEACGQRGRTDEVAKHHRELSTLGVGRRRCKGWRRRYGHGRVGAEGADGGEELTPVADRGHADADQIVGRQMRQHLGIDIVLAKRTLVLFETQALQPAPYVHRGRPGGPRRSFLYSNGDVQHRMPQLTRPTLFE